MQARNTSGTDTFVVASLYSDYPYEKIKLSPSIIVTGTPLDTTPPSRAVLLSPANGSAYKTNMLQLNWNRATDNLSGVSNYSVQISTNKFINVFTNYNALGTNCAVSLLNNKKWYWRVKASDKAGNQGAWSLTNIFYIDTIPPVLSGRTPSSNKVTGSLCVKFQWDAQDSLSGIFSNLMEIDTNKDLMPDIITVLPSLVSGYSNTFTHNGTNRWRIVAVDAAQNTNRSSWYSIVINTNLPVPVLLTPLNNSATNNTTVRFDWSNEKNKGMISNIIQISSNNFVTLTFRSNLQTNNCSVYLLSGQYQWRVVAFSSVSSYTSITPFSLTIDSIPPSLVLGQPSGTYISEINFRITAFKTASHVVIDTNAVVTAVVTENDLLKGTYSQSNGRFNMPLGEGKTYLIRCYAVDKLNNHSATNTVEYKILKGLNAPAAIYPTIVNLNKSKKMKFVLSEKKAGVLIKIYTLRGSLVKEINNADLSSGFFEWEIDNLSLFPAGRYIVLIDNKKTYLVIVK